MEHFRPQHCSIVPLLHCSKVSALCAFTLSGARRPRGRGQLPPLLPFAAQTLALLGRKLAEAPPLLPQPLAFLGREVPELPETFPEGLAPLRRHLLPPPVIL